MENFEWLKYDEGCAKRKHLRDHCVSFPRKIKDGKKTSRHVRLAGDDVHYGIDDVKRSFTE